MKLNNRLTHQVTRQRQANNSLPTQTSLTYSSSRARGDKTNQKTPNRFSINQKFKRYSVFLGLIIAIILFIKLFGLSTAPNVSLVASSNNNAIVASKGIGVYKQAIESYLSESLWNQTKLTISTSNLDNYITSKYPEIASASASVPFLGSHISVVLTPTVPNLIMLEPNGVFVLDQSGRVISEANSLASIKLNLPVVTDQSGLSLSLGKLALSSNNIYFIEEVVGQLEAKGYKIASLTLPGSSAELDIRLVGQPYYIKFNLNNNDPRLQAGTFLAVISHLKSQNITPTQYVDVRVDGRAYYK